MPSQTPRDDQSVYVRMSILIVGWALAGVLLYTLSTILPPEVMVAIAVAAWVIVRFDSRKTKSLGSLLCLITCLLTGVCGLTMYVTHWHEDVLVRLIFVGLCLGAVLILLDRQADGWS